MWARYGNRFLLGGILSSSVHFCEANEEKPYIGIFLNEESRKLVHSRLKSKEDKYGQHVTLAYDPSEADIEKFEFGKAFNVNIVAIAQDECVKTAIVKVVDGEDISPKYAHITLHAKEGSDVYDGKYSNVLLKRLDAVAALYGKEDWKGKLDAFQYEFDATELVSYPATKASIQVLKDPIEVSGVVCNNESFDAEKDECVKGECGFCLFMRAGPCGEAFTAWEKCLEKCKKDGTDFVDNCGPETLRLRDCVDAHPEYYSVLNEDGENDSDDVVQEDDQDATTIVKDT